MTSNAAHSAPGAPHEAPGLASAAAQRSFFWLLVRRDLKTRYAGSTLGAIWNVIHPVTMMLIYIAIFSSLMKQKGEPGGHPLDYAMHLTSGMLVWLTFSEMLGRGTGVVIEHGNFLKKIWFPPLLLHLSVLFNVLFVYVVGWAALTLLLLVAGQPLSPWLFAVPLIMALAGAAGCGLSMILSGLNVFFRDTAQFVTIAIQIGFWFNPIVYPKSLIQKSTVGDWSWALNLNPIAHFVSLAQSAFGDPAAAPAPWGLAVVLIFPVACLLAGRWLFNRMLTDIRDGL